MWLENVCEPYEAIARRLDEALWEESVVASGEIRRHAEGALRKVEYRLGGGGIYPFLYFLTRLRRPKAIVETGVAAGFSSAAFLRAMRVNGVGRLYSSDFPYFRLPYPERFIGVAVDEGLRDNWTLLLDGDEANLPAIVAQVDEVDLFHYDSDKSFEGRAFALGCVLPKLSAGALLIMDDVQDDSFFYDLVQQRADSEWHVVRFEGKFVGLLGPLLGPGWQGQ